MRLKPWPFPKKMATNVYSDNREAAQLGRVREQMQAGEA